MVTILIFQQTIHLELNQISLYKSIMHINQANLCNIYGTD